MKKKVHIIDSIWFIILSLVALAWVYPVFMILINSLKKETAISTDSVFSLPTAEIFAGLENYINAIEAKGFLESLG